VTSPMIIPGVVSRTDTTGTTHHTVPAADRSGTRGMPMAGLPAFPRDASMRYAIVALDNRGRLADQSIMAALRWGPGQRVDIGISAGAVVIQARDEGVFRLNAKRHVFVPAAVRRWWALAAGDRVLLAAAPDHGVLVVHTMAALDAMLVRYHTAVGGGDRDE
jgi:hypothetical protein